MAAGLRRDVLRQLATLGCDESIFQAGRGRIDLDAEPDYDSLIELIRSTVHPITWDEVGPPGSIAHFKTNLSLVISQMQEVQESPELLLRESLAFHNRGVSESDVVRLADRSESMAVPDAMTPPREISGVNLNTTVADEVEETGRIMLGVGVNSDAGLVGDVVLDEKNFAWAAGAASDIPHVINRLFGNAGVDRDAEGLTMMLNPRIIAEEGEEEMGAPSNELDQAREPQGGALEMVWRSRGQNSNPRAITRLPAGLAATLSQSRCTKARS